MQHCVVKELSRNVHRVDIQSRGKGWEQWFLLSSDRHHDNAHADQKLEKRHLDQARERDAGIIDVGDLFCAMQGKYDPRSDRSQLSPEYQDGHYLDKLVNHAIEFYEPYSDLFVVIGRGNHETSIEKRHETDLIRRLCDGMSAESGTKVHSGGYGGWVQFVVHRENNPQRWMVNLKYFHGAGGGGPVTRGTIQTNRYSVYLPDGNIIVSGHTHDQWIVPITRERISKKGVVGLDECLHVRCGGYKEEYGDGFGGWHIETGKPPKPTGAMWLRFYWKRHRELGWEVKRTD